MYTLYYMPMCSASRAAKVTLRELGIDFNSINEPIWQRRLEFLKVNPEGDVPVILDDNSNKIIGYMSLVYFLDDNKIGINLLGSTSVERLEVRRLIKWLNFKFDKEVINYIVEERVFKSLKGLGQPSSEFLKAGRINLKNHEDYFEWLLDERTFLAGEFFSIADIAYASYLSSLDYLSEINWKRIPSTKKWYASIKSKPSFRDILNEKIYAIPPSKNYKNLDF